MDLQLAGQVVLVTGGGQGIGLSIGNAFAAEGAAVAFNHNTSAEGARAAAAQVIANGGRAIAVEADISDQAAVEAMVEQVINELGPIDVLVNNAAYTEPGRFLDMDPDSWQRMVDVTVVGLMRVTQAVLRGMVERGSGSIVSLMGDSGRVGESRLAAVATTRGSTSALMKSIAKEHGRNGVRANTVSLGLVQSPKFAHHTDNADDERMKRIVAMYPLGRVGQQADVPPLVLLLASPLASWITGQVISINGGYSMV